MEVSQYDDDAQAVSDCWKILSGLPGWSPPPVSHQQRSGPVRVKVGPAVDGSNKLSPPQKKTNTTPINV